MTNATRVILINEKDNVATALIDLKAGTKVFAEVCGFVERLPLISNIPMGHKFALKDIGEGQAVIKYGEPIGKSTTKILRGEHVHIHNVVSRSQAGLK
jgi:altronate dehydratase small subunit